MKLLATVVCFVALTSCASLAKYPNEVMYDMAFIVKDIAQSVDGELKFGNTEGLSKEQIINKSVDSHQLKWLGQFVC